MSQSGAVIAVMHAEKAHVKALPARCSTPFAQNVVIIARFLLNLMMTVQFTAAIAFQ